MTREDLLHAAAGYVAGTPDNLIAPNYALEERLIGTPMYAAPLMAVAGAEDPLFDQLRQPEAVGPHFLPPRAWLPEAKTVISFFVPMSDQIRADNRTDLSWPSAGWLHARIEGHGMLRRMTAHLVSLLTGEGRRAVAPSLDPRLITTERRGREDGFPPFSSSWSERHVAYICGLGTFGLSRGLITERGVAGRLTSLVTNLDLIPDTRPYSGLYDYCRLCGACARNCPAGAISLETGKDHLLCSAFLDRVRAGCSPRYGCGKCQVGVPCETRPCSK